MFPDPRRTAPVNTLDTGLVSVLSTGIHRSVGTPSALLHAVNMSEGLAFPSGVDLQEQSVPRAWHDGAVMPSLK